MTLKVFAYFITATAFTFKAICQSRSCRDLVHEHEKECLRHRYLASRTLHASRTKHERALKTWFHRRNVSPRFIWSKKRPPTKRTTKRRSIWMPQGGRVDSSGVSGSRFQARDTLFAHRFSKSNTLRINPLRTSHSQALSLFGIKFRAAENHADLIDDKIVGIPPFWGDSFRLGAEEEM